MQLNDFSSPSSSNTLNKLLLSKFGCVIDTNKFTFENLLSAKQSLTKKLENFELTESFDGIHRNEEYQKTRLFYDIIECAISERKLSDDESKKREIYVKGMKSKKKDFSKKYGKDADSVMHATATKMAKSKSVTEAVAILNTALATNQLKESALLEGEEEKASLIMSSRDMVDRLTGWLEDVASLRAESLLELLDSIRYELGSDISQQFANKVKPALEEVYNTLERNRQLLAQAVAILTGEEAPGMGAEGAPEPAPNTPAAQASTAAASAVPETGEELPPEEDEFAATAPAAGGEAQAGRAQRESIERKLKKKYLKM